MIGYDFERAREIATEVVTLKGMKYYFDENQAQRVVDYCPKFLRHGKGVVAGQPFKLAPWMEDVARQVHGWRVWENGERRYRRVWVEMPRKNAKTDFGGAMATYEVGGKPVRGGEFYNMAADEEQALILWNRVYEMIQGDDEFHPLRKFFYLVKTAIYAPAFKCSLRYLTGSKKAKHGKHTSGLFVDEVHEIKDDYVFDTLHRGAVMTVDYVEWMFTTAGDRSGFGWVMAQLARNVLRGVIDNPRMLVRIYAADEDDDPFDPKTWEKANPLYKLSAVLRQFLATEAEDAKSSPRLLNYFKRYHLGLWLSDVSAWLSMSKWDACTKDTNKTYWKKLEKELVGRDCYGGLDLASRTDICALVWVFPPDGWDSDDIDYHGKWHVLCRFWVPEEQVSARAEEGFPYEDWIEQGALLTTKGNITDYNVIIDQVMKDIGQFNYKGLAFDKWNSTKMITDLGDKIGENEYGESLLWEFRQGFYSMNVPTKELEALVIDERFEHGGQPLLRWMAKNVCVVSDDAENYKVSKKKSSEKIDGIVAAIMGLGLSMGEAEEDDSIDTGFIDMDDVA